MNAKVKTVDYTNEGQVVYFMDAHGKMISIEQLFKLPLYQWKWYRQLDKPRRVLG